MHTLSVSQSMTVRMAYALTRIILPDEILNNRLALHQLESSIVVIDDNRDTTLRVDIRKRLLILLSREDIDWSHSILQSIRRLQLLEHYSNLVTYNQSVPAFVHLPV